MKLVVSAADRRVLGVHIVGHGAAEMVQIAAIALTMGATKDDFDRTMRGASDRGRGAGHDAEGGRVTDLNSRGQGSLVDARPLRLRSS